MVHIHAEGPAFFCWIPKLFGKRVICTIHGLDWAREKWKFGVGSKFIRQGEKSAVKYADEIIVLSKGVQKYFMETYGRETHFIPNGVNRPEVRDESRILIGKNQYEQIEGRSIDLKCRLYRSKWIQSIAASDVMKFGQVVENPMIGAIPSRNEVQRELDDLLMSM